MANISILLKQSLNWNR